MNTELEPPEEASLFEPGRAGNVRGDFGSWLAVACVIAVAVFLLSWPNAIPTPIALALLVFAPAIAVAIHLLSYGAATRRRVLGTLPLFVVAFTLFLAPRAVSLASGVEGRYFTQASGRTIPTIRADLAKDQAESNLRSRPPVDANYAPLSRRQRASFRTTRAKSYTGSVSIEWRFEGERELFAALFPNPVQPAAPLASELPVAASAAVYPLTGLRLISLNIRYLDASGEFLRDRPLLGPESAVHHPRLKQWYLLEGTATAPPSAARGQVLLAAGAKQAPSSSRILVDTALIVPGAASTLPFIPGMSGPIPPFYDTEALLQALSVALALIAAIFAGYLLPLGSVVAPRVPTLDLAAVGSQRGATLTALGLTVIGVLAYTAEIASYGGYGSYLDSLSEASPESMGHWYLRAMSLLPTGIAVSLIVRRLPRGASEPWTAVELGILGLGVAIPLSYLFKTALVIPVLQVLFVFYYLRRSAIWWMIGFGAVTAILTPLIYWMRGQGLGGVTFLFTKEYWTDLGTNVMSRFFHFESLMISLPHRTTEDPWRPVVDVFATAVPRFLWEDKPLSPATRFTHEHLLHGLHAGTDTGTMSFPGELWMLGGPTGILVGGLIIGLVLRVSSGLFAHATSAANLLVAASLLSFLIFLNDGWGLSSTLIHWMISSVGWIVFLRWRRGSQHAH